MCGLLFPDCFTVFFALGCTWEVYDVVMGLCTNKMAYWAPRFPLENLADVVCNVIGFMCGSYVLASLFTSGKKNLRTSNILISMVSVL